MVPTGAMAEACAVTGRAGVTVPHVAHGTTEAGDDAGSVAAEAGVAPCPGPSTAWRGMPAAPRVAGAATRSGVDWGDAVTASSVPVAAEGLGVAEGAAAAGLTVE
ncbi:MAG: hypothetical protein U0R66_12785 [Mycobacterium sp.]